MRTVEVIVGVVSRAHGIKGEVNVEPRTDEPDRRFAPGTVLREERGRRRLTVEGSRWHGDRLLVTFREAADRTAVEALRGIVLVTDVPAEETPQEAEEFYDRQLRGLAVRDADGAGRGTVADVVHPGPQDLLVVRTATGEERLVPFVAALVPVVDIEAGYVQLAAVGGLLEDLDDDDPEDVDA